MAKCFKNWENVSRRTKNDPAHGGDRVVINANGPEGHVSIILHSSGRVSVKVGNGSYVTVGPMGAV